MSFYVTWSNHSVLYMGEAVVSVDCRSFTNTAELFEFTVSETLITTALNLKLAFVIF